MKFEDITCFVCEKKHERQEDPLIRVRGIGMVHVECVPKIDEAIKKRESEVK